MRLSILQLIIFFSFQVSVQSAPATPDIFTSSEITTNSDYGKSLLASARRLDEDGVDYTWMSGFSLKFQGCHRIRTWNVDAENGDGDGDGDEDEVKIETKRLVRFRLCPTNKCSQRTSNGCNKGYGDYIVNVNAYVKAYSEAQRKQDDYQCESYLYDHCDCEEGDDKGDGFDEDICKYQCYSKARKYSCIENNPYYDDEGQDQYYVDDKAIETYFEGCSEFEPPNNERRLAEDDGEEVKYYIGSYCADQGGKIFLGMFTDDACTNFADKNAGRTTFKMLTQGQELPYSDYSMVKSDCVSCSDLKRRDDGGDGGDNEEDEERISEQCQEVYQAAGKCETYMGDNGPSDLNENACYYMEGIKIIRRDGIIDTSYTRPNKVASFFIFLFAVSFVLLGAFIYYLRMKLGMKINLNS